MIRFYGWAVVVLVGYAPTSWSFPDMIRHNYSNCTVCHAAPTGGGMLTTYGRALSVEALSTWGKENEGGILHGLIDAEKIPSWLNIGGDVRALQVNVDTPMTKRGRFFLMQGDLEAAVTIGKLTIDGTIGPIYERPDVYSWGSHHYYALYQVTDELEVRAGRYFAAFGLNIPEHEAYTRGPLGFDVNSETNNFEVGLVNEKISAYATASQARPELTEQKKENALSVQLDYTFAQKYRLGLGRWQGTRTDSSRIMTSFHGMLGFTERFYLLFDSVYQELRNTSAGDHRGLFFFARPGYEVFKGFHVYGVTETLQSDFKVGGTIQRKLGLGIQFFPRPHFDFQLQGYKEQMLIASPHWNDVWYILLHYWI